MTQIQNLAIKPLHVRVHDQLRGRGEELPYIKKINKKVFEAIIFVTSKNYGSVS